MNHEGLRKAIAMQNEQVMNRNMIQELPGHVGQYQNAGARLGGLMPVEGPVLPRVSELERRTSELALGLEKLCQELASRISRLEGLIG